MRTAEGVQVAPDRELEAVQDDNRPNYESIGRVACYGLSVIMPCYNTPAEHLADAVNSIIEQQLPYPMEIVIVDDGSDDTTKKALAEIATQAELSAMPLRVIQHDENRGPAAARNTALEHAKYDFIVPVDADDMLAVPPESEHGTGFLRQAYEAMIADPTLDAVHADVKHFGALETTHTFPEAFDPKLFLERCTLWISGIYRRTSAVAAGGYDATLSRFEDFAFWARMLDHAESHGRTLNVKRLAEPLYMFRRYPLASEKRVGSQIIDRHRVGWRLMMDRFPHLYERHFPGMSQDELLDRFCSNEATRLAQKGMEL